MSTIKQIRQFSQNLFKLSKGINNNKVVKVIKPGNNTIVKDKIFNDLGVLDLLSEGKISTGENIERMVHNRISKIERINLEHQQNIDILANKLVYIQNNIGIKIDINDMTLNKNRVIVSELLDMNINEVYKLVDKLCNSTKQNNKSNLKIENELAIILTHLVFRNALTANIFSRIIMKFGLNNLKNTAKYFFKDPENFICDWNKNSKSRMICGLSLAARFKLLKSYDNALMIIKNEFTNVWMKTILENSKILNLADFKNLANVVNNLIEDDYLINCILNTNNEQLIYCFWEIHSNNFEINEWLENKCKENNKLNKYQRYLIKIYTDSIISTNYKWKINVINISKNLNLCLLNAKRVNKEKFLAYNDILINEISDGINTEDLDRLQYLEELRMTYKKFKDSLKDSNENKTNNNRYDNVKELLYGTYSGNKKLNHV